MATAIVVGGLGYIGRSLSRELAGRGWRVHITTRRRRAGAPPVLGATIHYSTRSPADLPRGLEADAVFYLPGRPGGLEGSLRRVHVDLAREWATYAAETGALFVYTSSIAVTAEYGGESSVGDRIVEEEPHLSGRSPRSGRTAHARTKAEMEALLVSGGLGERLGGRFTIVRPAMVYGGENPHLEWRLLRLLNALRIRPESRVLPVVSVECLARLLAGPVAGGSYEGRWVNAVEPRSLGEALDRVFGPCSGPCARPRIDGPARILTRPLPGFCKGALAYSLLSPGKPYGSKFVGDPCTA